jgi:hypothetical protein
VRGRKVKLVSMGTKEELEMTALNAPSEGSKLRFDKYIGYFYSLATLKGCEINIEEVDLKKFPNVTRTALREFLEQNFDV